MSFDDDTLDRIYRRTRGQCHMCRKSLARKNYGQYGERGAWEVDHSQARSQGGTDHLNNLRPACISCNRSKGASSSRSKREKHGYSREPYSPDEYEAAVQRSTVGLGTTGALLGYAVWGASGAFWVGLAGMVLGSDAEPEAP